MSLENVLSALKGNQHVLVSGRAGTGKTFLLKQLRDHLILKMKRKVCVCAPTGVAAVNIGGQTLYSWLGLGLAKGPKAYISRNLPSKTTKVLRETEFLLIDEISMIDHEFFEKCSYLASTVHRMNDRPWGRIQVVCFGDFLQLPPVAKNKNKTKFVFQTDLWSRMKVHRLLLTKVWRQKDDEGFLRILNALRVGDMNKEVLTTMKERCRAKPPEGAPITRLTTYRSQAEAYNRKKLEQLEGNESVYHGIFSVHRKYSYVPLAPEDAKKVKHGRIKDNAFPVSSSFSVKNGAQVMLRCNSYMRTHNLCNGSLGTVVGFDAKCVTVLFDGLESPLVVKHHTFECEVGTTAKVSLVQIPLCLSWALTIHKSQGLTLSACMVSTSCFESGQFYTAASRVRSLKDLYLSDFCPAGLMTNKNALEFENQSVDPQTQETDNKN